MIRVIIICLTANIGLALARGDEELPLVPDGFAVEVIAREPLVSNPTVLAFDHQGRLFVAQGPQWRSPTPNTPGDHVDLLIDNNGDGQAESSKRFAEGFNSIQGLAWYGNDLWVANAPDLTVVRDTDGDDIADVYFRVYTGLGNLEHSLHGLNFAPDGKLYMSKGNSKGYNRLDQLAPKAFRDLWGLPSPLGAPDYTPVEAFTREDYQRNYHSPADDWGQQGGVLRCEPYEGQTPSGRDLEIVSRGFRNPWDITFDSDFNWLGTDNDQTEGDRLLMPFQGAHFGWGHPWSFSWTGEDHLPTVPVSGPTFEGSGTGLVYYDAAQFPESYRGVFFLGDWLRREIRILRPSWRGALMEALDEGLGVFAHAGGGRTMAQSHGRVFDPTDIEVGPDGCLYVLSWGHEYDGKLQGDKQTNAGRVYRIRHVDRPLLSWDRANRMRPINEWSLEELFRDLGSSVPAWRVDAQQELLARDERSVGFLENKLQRAGELPKSQRTWTIWTLARLGKLSAELPPNSDLETQIQVVRGLAMQHGSAQEEESLEPDVRDLFQLASTSEEPRLRFAAILGMWELAKRFPDAPLFSLPRWLDQMKRESDRLTLYAAWNAVRDLKPMAERREALNDAEAGAKLGLLLGLLADDALEKEEVDPLQEDNDPRVASIAEKWLIRTGAAKPLVRLQPEPGKYVGGVEVRLEPLRPQYSLTYTLDGSVPTLRSPVFTQPISMDRDTTLKVAVVSNGRVVGRVVTGDYQVVGSHSVGEVQFVHEITPQSGRAYEVDYQGLQKGKLLYTDRKYVFTDVPDSLAGAACIRVANEDDRSQGDRWLSFKLDLKCDVIVGIDKRATEPPDWMRVGFPDGFQETEMTVASNDGDFRLYRKSFGAGEVVLGGNTNLSSDSRRGNYLVILDRQLTTPSERPVTKSEVLAAMSNADPQRGRELFFHPRGAGCAKCHAIEGLGRALAPDLSGVGLRASADVIIDSILQPSLVITEGFAQQKILTVDGRILLGAVVEESGRLLKIVGSDGVVREVLVADIEARSPTGVSPMPAGFAEMMSAQQLADLVTWMQTLKATESRPGFSFQQTKRALEILYNGQRIATYLKTHPELTRRALVNVMTPSGIPVTRNYPPTSPQDIDPGYGGKGGIIHPVMHAGIWMGFGDVDGNDYWRLSAKVEFDGFMGPLQADQDSASFVASNRLMSEDAARVVCTEITRYRFEMTEDGLLIQIGAEYRSDERDFYFGDQEESGLAIRVASPLRVKGGTGTILNDQGDRNGDEIWGKQAQWFDYFGIVDGRRVGIMVVPSPENSRPSWLHARDYGVVAVNPFPKQPRERREPYVKTWVKKGESFKLDYVMLIHDHPASTSIDRQEIHRRLLHVLESDLLNSR